MSDAKVKILAAQIVRALAGPLRSMIKECRGKMLLSEIREQNNRVATSP
jgi:hypothetical protein